MTDSKYIDIVDLENVQEIQGILGRILRGGEHAPFISEYGTVKHILDVWERRYRARIKPRIEDLDGLVEKIRDAHTPDEVIPAEESEGDRADHLRVLGAKVCQVYDQWLQGKGKTS